MILENTVGFTVILSQITHERLRGTTVSKCISPHKEGVHSEMKISLIIRLTLLIMQIVLIFFHSISLAGRRGYGKVMQVQMT